MRLTTLVDILEREVPGSLDNASTRSNLARLYAERGCHAETVAQVRAQKARDQAAGDITAALAGPSRLRRR